MNYEIKIILVVEADDVSSAEGIGVAACLHLQETFNDDGSILQTFTDGVDQVDLED